MRLRKIKFKALMLFTQIPRWDTTNDSSEVAIKLGFTKR